MLEIKDIYKTYDQKPLLQGVSFNQKPGEVICLLGASGSGKSTLLRIIAGLETPERGSVCWDGFDLNQTPAHRRHFGLMFQDYALFPHRNVAENIAFGLQLQNLPKSAIQARVQAMLMQVNLQGFANRRVNDLSGGEQQRVALARALAVQPRLLMLDEPLGALDRALRTQLGRELRQQLKLAHIPVIYVTHDQEEAFTIADRILLLHQGQIIQDGTPQQVFRHPKNAWVAQFFGLGNLLPGRVTALQPLTVETQVGSLTVKPTHDARIVIGANITLLLRPEKAQTNTTGGNRIQGTVMDCIFQGQTHLITLHTASGHELSIQHETLIEPGKLLAVNFPAESIQLFTQ